MPFNPSNHPSEGLDAQEGAGGRETRAVLRRSRPLLRIPWSAVLLGLIISAALWSLIALVWFALQ